MPTLSTLTSSPTGLFIALLIGILLAPLLALIAGSGLRRLVASQQKRLDGWLSGRNSPLSRFWGRILTDRQDEWPILLALAVLVVVASFVFFNIVEDLLEGDPSLAMDKATYLTLRALRTPLRDTVMIGITELGDSVVVTTVAAVVALWLAIRRRWRPLAYWLTAVAGGSILTTVIKVALHRPRPIDLYHSGWDAFSFPSGHSTTNAVLYGFLAIILTHELSRGWRWLLAWAAGCLVMFIAFSRMYLGAHWLSDVVGGLTFGALWLAGLGLVYVRKQHRPIGAAGLLGVVAATLIVAGGINIAVNHGKDLKLYEVRAIATGQG